MRVVLREAGRQASRQGFVNTVIHWSPHTESRSCSRQDEQKPASAPALSVRTSMNYRVYQSLPASQLASFSQNCIQCVRATKHLTCFSYTPICPEEFCRRGGSSLRARSPCWPRSRHAVTRPTRPLQSRPQRVLRAIGSSVKWNKKQWTALPPEKRNW